MSLDQFAEDVLTFEVTVKVQLEAPNAGDAWLMVEREVKRQLWGWDTKVERVTLIDGDGGAR